VELCAGLVTNGKLENGIVIYSLSLCVAKVCFRDKAA
jgi:hypothetical protein